MHESSGLSLRSLGFRAKFTGKCMPKARICQLSKGEKKWRKKRIGGCLCMQPKRSVRNYEKLAVGQTVSNFSKNLESFFTRFLASILGDPFSSFPGARWDSPPKIPHKTCDGGKGIWANFYELYRYYIYWRYITHVSIMIIKISENILQSQQHDVEGSKRSNLVSNGKLPDIMVLEKPWTSNNKSLALQDIFCHLQLAFVPIGKHLSLAQLK